MSVDFQAENIKNKDKFAEPAERVRDIDETSDFFERKDFLNFFTCCRQVWQFLTQSRTFLFLIGHLA